MMSKLGLRLKFETLIAVKDSDKHRLMISIVVASGFIASNAPMAVPVRRAGSCRRVPAAPIRGPSPLQLKSRWRQW